MPRILATVVAVAALVVGVAVPAASASAASTATSAAATAVSSGSVQTREVKTTLAGFSAGNIISDAVFTKKNSMTQAQIQTFFNSKVSKCQSGYVCLKDFKITSVTRPADAYCNGYTGAANETAARIIYRVAQSCDINPQVLIVMLQKEQGLITHTWPSAWRYNIALGQGCPDTAPCDPNFIGFFHQIYGAARQMQIYMEGKWFQWYAPGNTWNILYNPNASCGSGRVYVANKATAALYYYTPYQPNAAALRAGYGLGNSCSAYGNRNFYNYFTDWFGPTRVDISGPIATEWNRLGGGTGQLGQPQMNRAWVAVNGGGYYQKFERGYIWLKSGASRAFGMANGPFLENYKKAGAERGAWGWPASEAVCALTGGGCKMNFQNGTTYYSSATQSAMVPKALVPAYTKVGAENSALGYPAAAAIAGASGALEQKFAKGTGVFSPATGLVKLDGGLLTAWRAAGGVKAAVGLPKAEPATVAANGSGRVVELTAGTIWESPTGAFLMGNGPFRTNYLAAGGPAGSWGWPASAAKCGLTGGGCLMNFQKGTVGYSPATGSVLMTGAVATEWLRVDPRSVGYPKTAATSVAANGGGTQQEFTAGTIYSSAAGAFAMGNGPFRTNYIKAGGASGSWGWPASGAKCGLTGGGCLMNFQKGTVGYSPATGSVLMTGAVATEWLRVDPRSVGYPKAAATSVAANGGGTQQEFTAGTIFSSAAGAFAMGNGPFRTNYIKAGGASGSWGWPTSGATCGLAQKGCTMQFQKGAVAYTTATGSRLVPTGAILDEWNRRGATSSALGYPTGAVQVVGTVTSQKFQGGTISFDSKTNVVTVK